MKFPVSSSQFPVASSNALTGYWKLVTGNWLLGTSIHLAAGITADAAIFQTPPWRTIVFMY